MNESQKHALLKVARDSVEAAIKQNPLPKVEAARGELVESNDPDLATHCGCFVTLKNGGRLRGCIGQFIADRPLVNMVLEMAKASATSDPRFFADPITSDELPDIDIEISVLSPLKKTTDPLSLRLGADGIYIKHGYSSGCFLPQVAEETGWSKEEFLSNCCSHKAGLSPDAWKDPKTEVFLFTAEVFGSAYKDI
ncbi:MAG: AmmeMemoRadiSam system protein A [Planctomycetota bacterium]